MKYCPNCGNTVVGVEKEFVCLQCGTFFNKEEIISNEVVISGTFKDCRKTRLAFFLIRLGARLLKCKVWNH